MTGLLQRIGAYFVAPASQRPPDVDEQVTDPPRPSFTPPNGSSARFSTPRAPGPSPRARDEPPTGATRDEPATGATRDEPPTGATASAIVFGAPALCVPVAAACAAELRARARAPAAVLCVWEPPGRPAPEPALPEEPPDVPGRSNPSGAATPGARRLVARLAAHDVDAGACGRLAWLRLAEEPEAAAPSVRRCLAIAGVPVVVAVAGPRVRAFEPLQAGLDLAIAVLPPDAEPALRTLVLGTLPTATRVIAPPLPPGPPRWAAMAGLGRLRSLPAGPS